jgi:hypothetical protein
MAPISNLLETCQGSVHGSYGYPHFGEGTLVLSGALSFTAGGSGFETRAVLGASRTLWTEITKPTT